MGVGVGRTGQCMWVFLPGGGWDREDWSVYVGVSVWLELGWGRTNPCMWGGLINAVFGCVIEWKLG